MPWEKQFNVDTALDRAMNAFWSTGYEATSTQTLLDQMGINRGSLYDTFGNKRDLFIKALGRYEETYQRPTLAAAAKGRTPREAISAFFRQLVDCAAGDKGRDGCLIVNTALELAAHDDEIAKIVAGSMGALKEFFQTNIQAGQAEGEIPAELNAREVADGLLGLLIGIRVLARSMPDKTILKGIAAQAEAMLG